jgi:hypothetical protein
MKIAILLSTLLLLVGCSSTPVSTSGDPPVRYARYVQVATFDFSPRSATAKLDILQTPPTRKNHVIAELTIDGSAENEGKLINALAWKARQLGADALVVLTPVGQRNYDALGIPEETHWIFRANAIVFDLEK